MASGTQPPSSQRKEKSPYQKKWYLLSQAEHWFYETLRQAACDEFHVFPKVRLLDLLWLPDTLRNRQYHLSRVMSKHVDFLLCHRQTVAPVLVIELDDSSHKAPDKSARDAFVNEVLQAAELPVLRIPVKSSYDPQELATLIQRAMGKGTLASGTSDQKS